jgi:hypothetical protein
MRRLQPAGRRTPEGAGDHAMNLRANAGQVRTMPRRFLEELAIVANSCAAAIEKPP